MRAKIEKIETPISSQADINSILRYLQTRQKVLKEASPYRSEVHVTIGGKLPIRVVHIGDTHLGHDHADPMALSNAVEQAGSAGAMGHEKVTPDPLGRIVKQESDEATIALHANIFDGVSSKFISTNTIKVGLDLDNQRRLARAILKGKNVVPISANTCHEGWAKKTATHDPTVLLVDDDVPVLYTGGQVILQDEDHEIGRVELYHNPGHGGTKQSPEGGGRARYREISSDHADAPDEIVTAHYHRLVAGQDVSRNPLTRKDRVVSLGVVGASKGSKEMPDEFLIGLGVPPRNQPADAGQGLVTIWRFDKNKDKMNPYPVADFNRAKILYEAVLLWELARRANAVEDLQGLIKKTELSEKPTRQLNQDKSYLRESDFAAKSEGTAPLYKTVAHEIKSELPVSIQFIGNLRVGSTSFQRETVKSLLQEIEGDPWRFWVATRRLINQGVSQQPDRFEVLKELANVLKDGKSSLLGVMLTDELRRHTWGKTVGTGKNKAKPLLPGDWLYDQSPIKGTPLIMPEAIMDIKLKETFYDLYLKDRLAHLTSLINPFHGLTRISEIWGIDADAMIGGNTEVVGWRTWMKPTGQLEIIVPGGFAEYIEKGIGNRVDYPSGGQGLVLFPSKKLLYSFASKEDLRDNHQALWLFEGLNRLNADGQLSLKDLKKKFKLNKKN